MAKTFDLKFDGYYRDINKASLPSCSGIYCVYTCSYDPSEKMVSLKKLIYIGQAEDINKRLSNHEKYEDWKSYLKSGETLCYNYTSVSINDLDRCENALIYKHQPIENTQCKKEFNYLQTTLNITGRSKFLNSSFTLS